jgi:hypothetical protein
MSPFLAWGARSSPVSEWSVEGRAKEYTPEDKVGEQGKKSRAEQECNDLAVPLYVDNDDAAEEFQDFGKEYSSGGYVAVT